MKYRVLFDDSAERDLIQIYAFVSEQSDQTTAYNYVRRILAWCRSLETFPNRGPHETIFARACE